MYIIDCLIKGYHSFRLSKAEQFVSDYVRNVHE